MGYEVAFECPLFSLSFETDAPPTPDVLDTTLTRINRAIADTLANVAPHANLLIGDDEDD